MNAEKLAEFLLSDKWKDYQDYYGEMASLDDYKNRYRRHIESEFDIVDEWLEQFSVPNELVPYIDRSAILANLKSTKFDLISTDEGRYMVFNS